MTERRRGAAFPLPLAKVHGAAGRGRDALQPQRLLREASRDARARAAPSGVGLDSAQVRQRMVQRLHAQGIRHEALLRALGSVPRHLFIDSALAAQAYEDTSLPIGHGQTISRPSVVARMLSLLLAGSAARARGGLGKVLEVGTGCGYQCALLAQLADSVVSIERVRDLFDKARAQLAPLRVDRVRLVHGDGMRGHAPNAPYHSIIAAAVGDEPAPAWLEQLAIGGRLIAPVRSGTQQVLAVIDRELHGYRRLDLEPVHFVPLKSGVD
ncbi:MAG: protein-L-isoaspartate(D-aspartate) O-methyltransferase [Burkholderiaceae bacterium]|nr:protein-L-isoaspartate(D-aspartate) O-methyltransferase [Ideonella sp.]MCC7285587.1 protein-L-isoaspartate(D-aspartate) O-methyltransferase [Burkholderiaceae bacterium]